MREGVVFEGKTGLGVSPFLVVVLTVFIDSTGFGMVIPLLPFYAASLGAGSTALGVLVMSFSLMQFVFSPVLGRVSDRVGRRPVLLLSILTSVASFVLFALADSFLVLLLSRMVAGMATEISVAQAYIADITSERERAAGMGRLGASHGAGIIVGPAIGGFLSVYGFWASGFAAAALALVNLLFAFLFLPEPKGSPGPSSGSSRGGGYLRGLAEALTRPLIGSVLVVSFIIGLAFSAIPVILPLLGMSLFNLGSVEMSYFFVYMGLSQIFLQGFVIGRLAKRFGEERLLPLGLALMTVGMFTLPLVPSIWSFTASITLMLFGGGITGTAVSSLISRRTPVSEQGSMLGVSQSVSSIARIPGPLIAGVVSDFAGLATPFFLSATFLMIALGLSVRVQLQARALVSGGVEA